MPLSSLLTISPVALKKMFFFALSYFLYNIALTVQIFCSSRNKSKNHTAHFIMKGEGYIIYTVNAYDSILG